MGVNTEDEGRDEKRDDGVFQQRTKGDRRGIAAGVPIHGADDLEVVVESPDSV